MVNEIDINTNATISKYFWQKSMQKDGGIDVTSGEKDYTILFFEALPDDFYDLVEDSGTNEGKIKGNLDSISGCKILKQKTKNPDDTETTGSPVTLDFNGYPIYRADGEEGFYVVMYVNKDDIEIVDPLTDIMARCINVIIPLNSDEEYTVKGFVITDTNDYVISYSNFTSPQIVKKYMIFNRMSTFIDVGLRSGV